MPEIIPVTDDIIEIIEEVVLAASPSPPLTFGHGTNAYQNLFGQDVTITGDTAWLFPVQINDEIKQAGNMITKYNITMLIGKLSDLSNDADLLKAELASMAVISKEIILKLDNDGRVNGVTNIRREPVHFSQDLCITGYAISMTVELEHEDFNYCLND